MKKFMDFFNLDLSYAQILCQNLYIVWQYGKWKSADATTTTTAVNFINVLRALFSYEKCVFGNKILYVDEIDTWA